MDKLKEKLKEVFGFSQFRGNQEIVIKNIMDGNNTFVIMPTGAGKSLCYQLPALLKEGTAIVISPLIALMKNQVDQLSAFGVNAKFLNSTLTKGEMNRVKRETLSGEIKLLYVAPESLTKEDNIEFLKQANLSFAAVDEAHCISEWGHDFRPEYRRIKSILDEIGNLPIIALTATATPKVQQDVKKNLVMDEADTFLSSFNRKNLYYEVRPKVHVKKQLIKFIKDHKGKSGIIYCLSRKKVEEIAGLLQVNDVKAAPYHAGLEPSVRVKNQDDFLNEEIDVIVATIAFGMGIDKPDVRFVIHYDTPKSLEGYYQETGRSGRDGLEGNCILFYRYKDILKLEKFQKDKTVTERENAKLLLDEMSMYSESSVCRRKQLLHYFGEKYDESSCGKTMWCDVCRYPPEKYEGQNYVSMVLEAANDTEERFGLQHLTDVIRGIENQYVKSYKQNTLPVFGKGKEEKEEFWSSVVRQTLLHHFLEKDLENIGVLKITELGREFLNNPHSITLVKDKDFESLIEKEDNEPHIEASSYDENLFELLKILRRDVAKRKNLPPYVIFQDPSLEEMATVYPTTKEELSTINGVGMGKITKFGNPFLELIQEYVDENDIITAADVVVKSAVNKSKTKIFIIQQIDRKIDLQEIADAKGLSFTELVDEIENICYSGTKLNLDYYVENMLDPDKQDEAIDYFLNSNSDKISDALDDLGDDEYDEEDLRLLRVKFLSDHAN
ncbi:MAG: DNA helicase RecQ [Cyclobacteriaceae bacterium]|nr:DNA helicase RecQ [Cyclobacteriaceae bacterium]